MTTELASVSTRDLRIVRGEYQRILMGADTVPQEISVRHGSGSLLWVASQVAQVEAELAKRGEAAA